MSQLQGADVRDHRDLGQELELFCFDEQVGAGLPLWLPNGTVLRDELEKLIKELEFKGGYVRVSTPQIALERLFQRSGHLEHYADDMFPPLASQDPEREREAFYLRPMNCPHHHRIFASRPRSYRELPLRLAEYGQIYRFEKSGALSGLMRARACCQNDAHIYLREDQVGAELRLVLEMYRAAYAKLGLKNYRLRLSKGAADPEKRSVKYVHAPEAWRKSEALLREVLNEMGWPYFEAEDEGAFYGPKIDVQFRSIAGKDETASTIQLDFSSAERMDLSYIGADGKAHRPYIIHRAPLGSHERFVALLVEEFQGAFPFWLAPVQVRVLPVADRHVEACERVVAALRARGIRAEVDASNETLGKRVRNAVQLRVPWRIVMGDRELEEDRIAARARGESVDVRVELEAFIAAAAQAIERRDFKLDEMLRELA